MQSLGLLTCEPESMIFTTLKGDWGTHVFIYVYIYMYLYKSLGLVSDERENLECSKYMATTFCCCGGFLLKGAACVMIRMLVGRAP